LAAVVEWPILLDSTTPIHLFMTGWVVRSNMRGFAMSVDKYEFRTMKMGRRRLGNKLSQKLANDLQELNVSGGQSDRDVSWMKQQTAPER
jgi:hypothetical protein